MADFAVVLDANVLYGIEVTDLLATMAAQRLFRPHWSPQILAEVRRNLSLRHDLDLTSIDRRLAYMNQALPGAQVDVPEDLIRSMPVNDKDRHVLALAVHVGASIIVTENLRDFPDALCSPFDVEAVSADAFVLHQIHLAIDGVLASVDAMAARRRRSPRTRIQIIERLSGHLPTSMTVLGEQDRF